MEPNSYHPFTRRLLDKSEVFRLYPVAKDAPATRDRLPVDGQTCEKNVIWTILKENVGKELWAITMPVQFNEPLSFLQRINEQLEYQEQLKIANKCMDPHMRLALVFSHSYMMLTNTIKRINKTFNPLLGETYEYVNKDLRCIMEQVSHHPPIAAYHAESNDFIVSGTFMMNTVLKLTSFKLVPTGACTVILKSTNERFELTRPVSRLYNYVIGKMYIWYEGLMECVNMNTNDKISLNFKKKGWTSKGDYLVEGTLTDGNGKLVYEVDGDWRDYINLVDPKTKEATTVCKRKPEPEWSERQFNFTAFAMQSNNLTQEQLLKLPPTDSRLRPDIRAYEYGDVKLAGEEKQKLEVAQRARRKENQDLKREWKPLWFEYQRTGEETFSRFKGEYWKCKETGKWPAEMLDLYN